MLYCPPNVTLSQLWVNHGVSHCFLETITAALTTAALVGLGVPQLLMYRRFATPTDQYLRPRSLLYGAQLLLSVVMVVVAVARLVLQATLIGHHTIYGYMVLTVCSSVVVWPLSVKLVVQERCQQLPSVPARGHGLPLLLFWTLVFVGENLTFLNLRNEEWWFDLTTVTDQLEFSLFVLRYTAACLLFILGLKAPGISTMRDYIQFGGQLHRGEEEDEEEQLHQEEQQQQQQQEELIS